MKIFGRKAPGHPPEELSETAAQPAGMGGVLGLAATRIGEIVDAADRAKEEIGAGLEAQAPAAGTKLSPRDELAAELARSLVDRTEKLAGEAESVSAVLARASAQLAAVPAPAEQAPPNTTIDDAPPADKSPVAAKAPVATQATTAEPPASLPALPFSKASGSTPPPVPVPVPEPELKAAAPIEEPPPDPGLEGQAAETPAPRPESGLQRRVTERFATSDRIGQQPRFKRRETSGSLQAEPPGYSLEGVRLLATQMAVAGSSREEIEARLLGEFGVEDANELLTDVLSLRKSGGHSATG